MTAERTVTVTFVTAPPSDDALIQILGAGDGTAHVVEFERGLDCNISGGAAIGPVCSITVPFGTSLNIEANTFGSTSDLVSFSGCNSSFIDPTTRDFGACSLGADEPTETITVEVAATQ